MGFEDKIDSEAARAANAKSSHLLAMYGKKPAKNLLHHQLDERKYFDSGDFALSQAHRSSDIGSVSTGSQHPQREDISQPRSFVPSSSNVDESANQRRQDDNSGREMDKESQLHGIWYPEHDMSGLTKKESSVTAQEKPRDEHG